MGAWPTCSPGICCPFVSLPFSLNFLLILRSPRRGPKTLVSGLDVAAATRLASLAAPGRGEGAAGKRTEGASPGLTGEAGSCRGTLRFGPSEELERDF